MKWPKFDGFILLCIVLSSLLMVFNKPLSDPTTKSADAFQNAEYVFVVIFTLEMLLKMISMGVIVNNNPVPEQFLDEDALRALQNPDSVDDVPDEKDHLYA